MSRTHSSRRRDVAPAPLDALEARRLLAVTFDGGVVRVEGTEEADVIVVSVHPSDESMLNVRLNDEVTPFEASAVSRMEIFGLGGDDRILADHVNGDVTVRMRIRGGAGNDTIVGGDGRDFIDGNIGRDYIDGGRGRDVIEGGSSNDLIYGGISDDLIDAEQGNDFVNGQGGDDQVYGGAGDDTLHGSIGNDTLGGDDEDALWAFTGGAQPASIVGNDRLDGGPGDDWLTGGIQSDIIVDDNGRDTFIGGDGADVLSTRGRDPSDDLEKGFDDVIRDRDAGDVVPIEDVTGPIPPGEEEYAVHIHAYLKIFVDGVLMRVPDRAGEFNGEPVFHTHEYIAPEEDVTGIGLHMHDMVNRTFRLEEFFENWGITLSEKNLGRHRVGDNGKTLTMTVNGAPNTQFDDYQIQNGAQIVIRYE